ncbi:hypothetical protein [Chondrinema litorale]|uniref:hypothetical protein n=1 Tax=Chondrinema litorale TaxID=2994555 RepID=UPI0025431A0B|nr:hypothetical protein [Chondrinema litorale]UZR96302.1 hypothetical protein OQ292_21835 [Chondrinema litorale]
MKYSEAKNKVLEFLNRNEENIRKMVYEPAIEFEYGWIFTFDQEGVFHPKIDEVLKKIKSLKDANLTDNQIFENLSDEDLSIYENSIGLVGQAPVFIDKENGEVSYCLNPSIELEIQKIKEQKRGKKFYLKLYFIEDIRGNPNKIKELKNQLGFTNSDILKFFHKKNNDEPIFELKYYEKLLFYKGIFEENSIKIKIEELELKE